MCIRDSIVVDASFISNMKRFKSIQDIVEQSTYDRKIIVTSNITVESNHNVIVVDYSSYINEEQCIADNAGLMCINLLKKVGVQDIVLAGFDGFSTDIKQNFYEQSMTIDVEAERLIRINVATAKKVAQLEKQMKIKFLTNTVYKE